MEIWPLAYKPKQESLIASVKKVHANDVYQKNLQLKMQAKSHLRGRKASQKPDAAQRLANSQKQSTAKKMVCPHGQRNSQAKLSTNKLIEKQQTQEHQFGLNQEDTEGVQFVERSRTQSPADALAGGDAPESNSFKEMLTWSQQQQIKVVDGPGHYQAQKQVLIGISSDNNSPRLPMAIYSNFQNITLVRELADENNIRSSCQDTTLRNIQQQQSFHANKSIAQSGHSGREPAGEEFSQYIGQFQPQIQMVQLEEPSREQRSHLRHQTISVVREMASISAAEKYQESRHLSQEKRNFINAEIVGSLKPGYGFLPNFMPPNNQGRNNKSLQSSFQVNTKTSSQSKRASSSVPKKTSKKESSHGLGSSLQTKTLEQVRQAQVEKISPLIGQRKQISTPWRKSPDISILMENDQKIVAKQAMIKQKHDQLRDSCNGQGHSQDMKIVSEVGESIELYSHQAPQSQDVGEEEDEKDHLSRNHQKQQQLQTGATEDEVVNELQALQAYQEQNAEQFEMVSDEVKLKQVKTQHSNKKRAARPRGDKQNSNVASNQDQFQSPSLHERYNKVIRSVSPCRQCQMNESQQISVITTSQNQSIQPGSQRIQSQVRVVINQSKLADRLAPDQQRQQEFELKHRLISPRGVPFKNKAQKGAGKLKSLRTVEMPQDGIVQPNHPVTQCPQKATELNTQRLKMNEKRLSNLQEMGQQTSDPNLNGSNTITANMATATIEHSRETSEPVTFEIVRSAEQMLNFNDNVSEGTNRMSAIKLKQSKMSGAHHCGPAHTGTQNTSMKLIAASHVTFEPDTRRSVEVPQMRTAPVDADICKNSKSKSIDSVSNLHEMIQLKPKGIEVYSMSLANSEIGTPKAGQAKKMPSRAAQRIDMSESKQISGFSPSNDNPNHQSDVQKLNGVEGAELMTLRDDKNQTPQPMKSGVQQFPSSTKKQQISQQLVQEPIKKQDDQSSHGAQLPINKENSSSASGKSISMIKDKSLISHNQPQDPAHLKMEMLQLSHTHQSQQKNSQSSIGTSIKTSIDDETLMELAKKGINAKTPVVQERKKDNDEKLKKTESERKQKIMSKRDQTSPETPDSNFLKLHSTLQLSDKSASCLKVPNKAKADKLLPKNTQKNITPNENSINYVSPASSGEGVSNRSIIYSSQSPRKVSVTPNEPFVLAQGAEINEQEIQDGSNNTSEIRKSDLTNKLDTKLSKDPNFDSILHNNVGDNSYQNKVDTNLTFSTQVNKQQQIKMLSHQYKTEIEAHSQTDFGPLPPLDSDQFSLDAIHGNYEANLMLVQNRNQSDLRTTSPIQANSIQLGAGQEPTAMLSSANALHSPFLQKDQVLTPTQRIKQRHSKCLKNSPDTHYSRNVKLDQRELITQQQVTVQTDVPSQLSGENQELVKMPDGIKVVEILSQEATQDPINFKSADKLDLNQHIIIGFNNEYQIVSYQKQLDSKLAQTMVRKDMLSSRDLHLSAINQGKRIIYKRVNSNEAPVVVNQRVAEIASSPDRHHLIQLQGQPLQAVNLKDRSQPDHAIMLKCIRKMRMLPGFRRSQDLSREFAQLTQNMVEMKSVSQVGVDKSIGGEDPSLSPRSFTRVSPQNQREYYFMNVDSANSPIGLNATIANPNVDETLQLVMNQSQRSSGDPQPITIDNTPMEAKHDTGPLTTVNKNLKARGMDMIARNMAQAQPATTCLSRNDDNDTIYIQSINKNWLKSKKDQDQQIKQKQRQTPTGTDHEDSRNTPVHQNEELSTNEAFSGFMAKDAANLPDPRVRANTYKKVPSKKQSQNHLVRAQKTLEISWKKQISHNPDALLSASYKLKQNEQEVSIEAPLFSGKGIKNQIQIRDESELADRAKIDEKIKDSGPAREKSHQRQRFNSRFNNSQQTSTNNNNNNSGKHQNVTTSATSILQKNKFHSNLHSIKSSDSEVSLQKLQRPVAEINVNKGSKQQFATMQRYQPVGSAAPPESFRSFRASQENRINSQRSRPKTSENMPRLHSSNDYSEPRNRKIIYLMHKRREMALRKANHLNKNESEVAYAKEIAERKKKMESFASGRNVEEVAKPSFFEKVSQKLSKVFSSDRATSTRVASSNAQANLQSQTMSAKKSTQTGQQDQSKASSNGKINLHLTVNPCSTNDYFYPKKSSVCLRSKSNPGGMALTARAQQNKQVGTINATSAALISPESSNHCSQQYQHFGEQFFPTKSSGDELLILDAYWQQQRQGLKTAEGGQRMKRQFAKIDASIARQSQIDLNSKFKGFNRRQTHDKVLQQINQKLMSWGEAAAVGKNYLEVGDCQFVASQHVLSPRVEQQSLRIGFENLMKLKPPRTTINTPFLTSKSNAADHLQKHREKEKLRLQMKKQSVRRHTSGSPSTIPASSGLAKQYQENNPTYDVSNRVVTQISSAKKSTQKKEDRQQQHLIKPSEQHRRIKQPLTPMTAGIHTPLAKPFDMQQVVRVNQVIYASASTAEYEMQMNNSQGTQSSVNADLQQNPSKAQVASNSQPQKRNQSTVVMHTETRRMARHHRREATFRQNYVNKLEEQQRQAQQLESGQTLGETSAQILTRQVEIQNQIY